MKRNIFILGLALASLTVMSSCDSYWATSTIGSDLYLDSTYGPGYYGNPYYNLTPPPPGPAWPQTPPPPKPKPHPQPQPPHPGHAPSNPGGNQPGGNPPGGNNVAPPSQGNNGQRPNNGNPGTPSQGGYRGQNNSGSNTRH